METKIPDLIINKGQELIKQLVPPIVNIASQTGIQDIGTSNVKLPDTCLTPEELQKILNLRNVLVDKLNTTVSIIDKLSKPLNILTPTVNTLSAALQVADAARIAANTAMVAAPVVPGAAPALINNLKDLEEFISPKITIAKNTINTIQLALDYVKGILTNLINIFKSIDKYLIKCKVVSEATPLTPLNDYLQQLDQQQNMVNAAPTNQTYKGFILEVREEQFSPTVKRVKAVALNPQGIVLLQTPLSFTTTPQVLIQELKLIIDSSNLKAE